jgi:hypothetical protein
MEKGEGVDLIMVWVMSGLDRGVSSCRVKILGPRSTQGTVGSGCVEFGFFSYNFRVESGFFLIRMKILAHVRPIKWSGLVGFFRAAGLGLSGRVAHDQV